MSTIESVLSADNTSGQAGPVPPSSPHAGFAQFVSDFRKYEKVLDLMVKATSDPKFKQEIATIEQWFQVLDEPEKNASVHWLLNCCSQDQLRFLQSVISGMIKPEDSKVTPVAPPERSKFGKLALCPPSLDLADFGSPLTPTSATVESAVGGHCHESQLAQALHKAPHAEASTPNKDPNSTQPLPGFSGINPYTLNMLANAGLSKEAQLLAAQLVMSGLVQPTSLLQQSKSKKPLPSAAWRTPPSARFPASALRSSVLRTGSGLKSAALKNSGLVPQTPMSSVESPRPEDFSPELLNDIPGWLKTLRLHKYTDCLDGLTWQQIVVLDDASLEARGVVTLGARRRLLRTFEHVRKEMNIEGPSTPTSATPVPKPADKPSAPNSTLPRSKLSANSPIFTPTWEANKGAKPTLKDTPMTSATD